MCVLGCVCMVKPIPSSRKDNVLKDTGYSQVDAWEFELSPLNKDIL